MNEYVFKEILGESLKREFAEFDNAPGHKFSLKHRLSMKRVFVKYKKNTHKTIELSYEKIPRYRLKQKLIIVLVIIILMTLITGWFFPLHRITEMQINWLRSRYDFPNMLINIPMQDEPNFNTDDAGICFVGMWRTNDDYINFLSDLEELGIYTAEETDKLLYKSEPIDTRPVDLRSGQVVITRLGPLTDLIAKQEAETPLSSAREFVSHLEHQIGFYTERSKDKARAVEGDEEFAALISEHYLPLQKSFLELLEKLYAEPSDDDLDKINNVLLVLDKDDRRYLFKINELEKC